LDSEKMTTPFVSIIIPARNEEKFIGKCLESIVRQTYRRDRLEIIVVDGMSTDRTREIAERFKMTSPISIRIIPNERRVTPVARNIGIKNARGDFICFLDAHAEYSPDYIARCTTHLAASNADVVGGNLSTMPYVPTAQARAIAEVLHHPLGVGGSRFRMGSPTPQWVDAVFGGCYRKGIFSEVGMFNENLIRSQDMEFFIRLKRAGKKILLAPDIECTYYPKQTIKDFFVHNIKDGIWAVYPLKFVRMPLRLRHYIPLFFITSALGLATASIVWTPLLPLFLLCSFFYASIVVGSSFGIAIQKHDPALFLPLIAAFAARHFGYGIGSLVGILKLLVPSKGNGNA
jgi:glycosyltransferase involved in cell wall biosynthesis